MLVKLFPEQFKQGWDLFGPLVKQAIPPEIAVQEKALSNILRSVLMERATAWVEIDREGSKAFLLTVVDQEPLLHYKRLLIYVLNVFGNIDERETWYSAVKTLKKHAEAKDCREIVMYVTDDRFERHLASLGVDVSTTFMQIPVD